MATICKGVEAFKLSEEQVQSFNENGFLSGVKMLDEHQITTLRKELEEIADPKHP